MRPDATSSIQNQHGNLWRGVHRHPCNQKKVVAQKMVAVLDHPLYSPDLPPADFFLLPCLKAAITGARFMDVNAIKDRVTAILQSIPQESFADYFRKLYECCQICVVADGDYSEGQ